LIPDPADPQCCKKPQCPTINNKPPIITGTNPPQQPQYVLTFGPGQTFTGGTRPTIQYPSKFFYNIVLIIIIIINSLFIEGYTVS